MTFSDADHAVGSEYGGTVAKREQWKPVATYTLMGITIAIYLLQMLSQFTTGGGDYPAAIGMKVNVKEQIIQGSKDIRIKIEAFTAHDVGHASIPYLTRLYSR